MKRIIYLTLLSLFLTSFCLAQDKKYTDSAVTQYIEHCKCEFKNYPYPHNVHNLKKNSPYNLIKQIVFISFKNTDSLDTTPYLKDNQLLDDKILEKYTLSGNDIDSLLNIFLNYGYKGHPLKILQFQCRKPENAILFIDKNNQVLISMEISFSGTAYNIKTNKKYKGYHTVSLGQLCFGKFEILSNFFSSLGAKYIH